MKLKMDNGQLLVKDDIGLLETRTFGTSKPGNSGIVYNYLRKRTMSSLVTWINRVHHVK